jgi:SAM-dependent methyltransferase
MNLLTDYERVYEKGSSIPQQQDAREVTFFASLISHRKPLRVLDIGCAEGKLSIELALKGHHVTALDVSPSFLRQTKEKAARYRLHIDTVRANIEGDLPRFRHKFDVIYCMDVIEHLKSPVNALNNIRSLLAEGGQLFIHTENSMTLGNVLASIVNNERKIGALHLYTFDFPSLKRLLSFVGFGCEIIPTRIRVPKIGTSGWLARRFPEFSESLLVRAWKEKPLDCEEMIKKWKQGNRCCLQ